MAIREQPIPQVLFRVTLVYAGPVRKEDVYEPVSEVRRTPAGTILLLSGSGWKEVSTANLLYMNCEDLETVKEQEKAKKVG